MKTTIYALLLSVILFSCQNKEEISKTYLPRDITKNESFNQYPEAGDSTVSVVEHAIPAAEVTKGGPNVWYSVKFGDTTIRIQTNPSDTASATGKFLRAQHVNTQKTSVLVQVLGKSELTDPFYLITLKDKKIEVASLNRNSTGGEDTKYTRGLARIGRDGFLINNDFFVTNVNAKVYMLKRQKPEERIQGQFFMQSHDKQTLVFIQPTALYQVHYPSGETFTTSVPPHDAEDKNLYTTIMSDYTWERNKVGITFLKKNSDKIIDIKDFR